MKIKLLAYNGVEHYVEIPDNTEKLLITIVSGDMIMHSPFHYDTGTPRLANFFDGYYIIPKKNFAKLEELEYSYDLSELSE